MIEPARAGVIAMIAVCAIWGMSPIYYGWVSHVPPLEVMCHRAIWSAVLFVAILTVQGRFGELKSVMADRSQRKPILAASLAIAINWYLFILATAIDRVSESSLGYYVFPLVSVGVGWAVLGERLSKPQWAAVGIASAAVALLGWGLGEMPWIALGLAITMTIYGLMKRYVTAGPMVSVAAEAIWVAPLAIAWVLVQGQTHGDVLTWLLLMGTGPMTAIPLLMFSYAAQRISMATQGFLMYLNPSIQAVVAFAILAEPLTQWHAIGFPMIWVALALYSLDVMRRERRARVSPAP
ncbi:MAG: EamA family transporter RarD [Pseudomonadota bacterium]